MFSRSVSQNVLLFSITHVFQKMKQSITQWPLPSPVTSRCSAFSPFSDFEIQNDDLKLEVILRIKKVRYVNFSIFI